jgi:hypothetical protein
MLSLFWQYYSQQGPANLPCGSEIKCIFRYSPVQLHGYAEKSSPYEIGQSSPRRLPPVPGHVQEMRRVRIERPLLTLVQWRPSQPKLPPGVHSAFHVRPGRPTRLAQTPVLIGVETRAKRAPLRPAVRVRVRVRIVGLARADASRVPIRARDRGWRSARGPRIPGRRPSPQVVQPDVTGRRAARIDRIVVARVVADDARRARARGRVARGGRRAGQVGAPRRAALVLVVVGGVPAALARRAEEQELGANEE